MLVALALGAVAYVAGSSNVAIHLFRAFGRPDPRAGASGNPGVTNVYRLAGPGWAAAVLLIELLRAAVLAALALWLVPLAWVPLVGLALVAGNRWPVFHGFRGGKGVSNYLGFTLVLSPVAAGLAAAAWVAVFALGRQPFLGSFAMIAVLAGGAVLRCEWAVPALAATAGTLALIVAAHRPNLARFRRQ